MGIERFPVLAPGLCVRLQVRHIPARLTDLRVRRRRVGKALREFLVGKAMLRVGLPVHVEGELHEGPKALLTLPQRLFRPLALGQIKDEANALICTLFEHRPADQHGHTASVFTQIFLLEWRERPDQLQLRDVTCVEVAPFRRRQHRTVQASRGEILAVVTHDTQKRVIGLKYATFEVPDHDPDDIGVDEASDLPVALLEIAVELDVLLGRLSPSLRLAPRECQRRARQDGDNDDGSDGEPRPALFEFAGALLPIHEPQALNVLQQVDLQSDIVHAADHRLRRLPGYAGRRFDDVVDLAQLC